VAPLPFVVRYALSMACIAVGLAFAAGLVK
jgi:hypothetical protein